MILEAQVECSTDLATVVCGSCGGIYAIAERYHKHKQELGGYWNCPYCQCSWGFGTSTIDKLNKKLADAQRQVEQECKLKEWAQQDARLAENRRRAAKGQLTKVKKRIGNGVCPCCNRSFENLRNHMLAKHPTYSKIMEE